MLPSTSPANAAVPYAERLRWFEALREWLVPVERRAVRALVLDADDRVLLVQFRRPIGDRTWWGSPGGGIDPGESHQAALRRELREEIGLEDFEVGPTLYEHVGRFPWAKQLYHQHNTTYLVRVHAHEPVPTIDLDPEGVADLRWWTADELAASTEQFAPPDLPERVRRLTA